MSKKTTKKTAASPRISTKGINREKAFVKNKAKTIISNVGFYLMIALDVGFLITILMSGFEFWLLVMTIIVLSLEGILVLMMLPIPLLQVGIVKKNVMQLLIFLLMPLFEIIAALTYIGSGYTGTTAAVQVYIIFAVARIIMWMAAFFMCRKGVGVGGATVLISVIAAAFVLGASGAVFEFPLGDRPLSYVYNTETVTDANGNVLYGEGYVVRNVLGGMRDNIRIPSTYKGQPVVAVDTEYNYSYALDKARTLELPESVEYCDFATAHIKDLIVHGDSVRFGNHAMAGLETVTFTSEKELPENLPDFDEDFLPDTIKFNRTLIDEAMESEKSDFLYARERFEPILGDGEHYVMYYTDCDIEDETLKRQYSSSVYPTYRGYIIDGFYEDTKIVSGSAVSLPEPDLSENNREFMGWYTSRDYTEQVTSVQANVNTKLYAKYRWLYTVDLYKNETDSQPTQTIKYHYESEDLVLPTNADDADRWSVDDYAFCGWFKKNGGTPQKNEDIKDIPTNSVGDKQYYPVYKQLYDINVVTVDGDTGNEIVADSGAELKFDKFHEWTDIVELDEAVKEGYTFIGWYTRSDFTAPAESYPWASTDGNVIAADETLYLKFNLNYNITVQTEGGSLTGSVPAYYHFESENIEIPEATRTGYDFTGWHADSVSGATTYVIGTGSKGDRTFVASWEPIQYTVRYDANGGTGTAPTDSTFTYDSASNSLRANGVSNFTRTGYNFAGWNIAGTTYPAGTVNEGNNFATTPVVVTASAVWEPIKYQVTYSGGEGATGSVAGAEFTYDSENTFAQNGFTKTGYTFDGWYESGKEGIWYRPGKTTDNLTSVENATVSLIAKWNANTYYINYAGGTGASGSMERSTFTYDSSNRLVANGFEKTGYTFKCWNIAGTEYDANTPLSVNFASAQGASVTATAQWTANTYYVQYAGNTGASGSMERSTFTYDSVNTLSANAFTMTGYTFSAWSINGREYQPGTVPAGTNFTSTQGETITAVAHWTANTYTVNYVSGADGTTGSTQSSTFTYGQSNTLRANGFVRTGYTFTGWRISNTTYPPGNVNVNFATGVAGDNSVTATAQWKVNTYTVRYDANGGTGNAPADSTFTYGSGNTLRANTFTRTGYTFGGWRINNTTYQPGTVPAGTNFATEQDAVVVASAVWEPITYTVTYSGGSDATGSTQSSTFTYGSANTLRECGFIRAGYRFVGWQINGTTYQPGTVPAGTNFAETSTTVTATAVWEPIEEENF